MYQKLIQSDICYICQKSGLNLISPCNKYDNISVGDKDPIILIEDKDKIICNAKVHKECLTQHINNGNNNCPKCSNIIITNKTTQLNVKNCCYEIVLIISYILTYIIGSGSPGVLIFGVLIDGRKDESNASGSFILSIILSFIIGLAYILSFIFLYVDRYKINDNIKQRLGENWCLYVMWFTSIIIDLIILLCHFFGFIFLYIFGKGYNYNPYSFCVGLAFIILFSITILIVIGIFCYCKSIYNRNLEERVVLGT